jgi:hypothetical protein
MEVLVRCSQAFVNGIQELKILNSLVFGIALALTITAGFVKVLYNRHRSVMSLRAEHCVTDVP